MKRWIYWTAILIVALGIMLWIYGYLTKGSLDITTSNLSNQIILTRTGDQSPLKQASGRLSVTLHTGKYIISVQNNSSGKSQVVTVRAHQTIKLAINLLAAGAIEPVISQPGIALTADDNNLLFINNDNHYLYRIDGQNNLGLIDNAHQFQNIKWSSPSLGIGQDASGALFVIQNNSVKTLKIPVAKADAYDISASGKIYISSKLDVYKGSASGDFSHIYTSPKTFSSLVAGDNKVALINSSTAEDTTAPAPYITIVDDTGKSIKKDVASGTMAAWSPSSKYLAVIGNLTNQIYDSSLNTVADLPNTAPSNLAWLSDSQLIYSASNQLWSFDFKTNKSAILANLPPGQIVTALQPDSQRNYVYMGTAGDNNNAVKRFGLKGQKAGSSIYELDVFLPTKNGPCAIDYINFKTADVTAISTSGASSQVCPPAVNLELQQDGLSLDSLHLKYL